MNYQVILRERNKAGKLNGLAAKLVINAGNAGIDAVSTDVAEWVQRHFAWCAKMKELGVKGMNNRMWKKSASVELVVSAFDENEGAYVREVEANIPSFGVLVDAGKVREAIEATIEFTSCIGGMEHESSAGKARVDADILSLN